MKVKTSELTGAALDWAVAKCEGVRCGVLTPAGVLNRRAFSLTEDEMALLRVPTETVLHLLDHDVHAGYAPSTSWSQGGPIIDREEISTMFDRDRVFDPNESVERWYATLPMICDAEYTEYGPTPLIAAMRCYVASKLGDEVDVPAELIPA